MMAGALVRCRWLVLLGGLPLAAPLAPANGQEPSRILRERARTMLHQLRRDLESHYYDSTYRGVDLDATFAEAETRVGNAGSVDELMAVIAQTSLQLGDSHTYFVPPLRTVVVDYGWEMRMIGDTCVVTEVRARSDAEKQGLRPGDMVVSVNGYRPTRENLWQLAYVFHALRPQPGLRVVARTAGADPRQLDLAARVRQRRRVLDLTAKDGGRDIWDLLDEARSEAAKLRSKHAELDSGTLVWRLEEFSENLEDARALVRRARERTTLVLDLRGNPGGAEETLLWLLGHLYEGEVPVATIVSRADTDTLVARGRGGEAFGGRVVVLVDSKSGSASEIFARTMQLTRRGIVIGDRTSGSVMRSRHHPHRSGAETVVTYGVSVTIADVVMPDGGRLEGRGVVPDEVVLPTTADIAAGRDPVLARALKLAGVAISPGAAGSLNLYR
jgi:C-terminal processing protease CtpA/Prc